MTFPDWLGAVELNLGFDLDADTTIEALRCYREGWTVDEYSTDLYYRLLGNDIEEVA